MRRQRLGFAGARGQQHELFAGGAGRQDEAAVGREVVREHVLEPQLDRRGAVRRAQVDAEAVAEQELRPSADSAARPASSNAERSRSWSRPAARRRATASRRRG